MTAGDTKFRAEIADLRSEVLNHFALVFVILCMAGLFLTLTFTARENVPWSAPFVQPLLVTELAALALAMLYGWLRWTEHRTLAFWLFACGLYGLSQANLFANPGILSAVWVGTASLLLTLIFGPFAGWLGVGLLLVSLLALPYAQPGAMAQPLEVLGAITPAVAQVAFMHVVARILFRNMRWMEQGYESMRAQSEVLRDQGAQLSTALKSLNQTSFALARANEQLEVMVKYAEDARSAKQEFAANISHELRAPLNLIIGFSDIILYGAEQPERYGGYLPPPAWLADLRVIRRNAQQLFKLVNDILDLSQMDMAYMTIVRKPTNVQQFIDSALDELGPLIRQRGLALRLDVAPDLPEIYADQNRILQVLLNLANNALRFTERGGITVRARAQTEDEGRATDASSLSSSVRRPASDIVISVADTGTGIAPADLERIFEPFTQATGATGQQKHGGSGLGLTISRRFVELHGGRMWAQSEPGRGSTFYFTLPVNPPLMPAGTSSMSRDIHRRELGALAVVERVPIMATMLERQLDGIGISHFDTFDELLRRATPGAPDCPEAILINEPAQAQSGAALPAAFARLPVLRCYIPAVLDQAALHDTRAPDGAARHQYLAKPFTREQLYAVIGDLLGRDPVAAEGAQAGRVARILVVEDDDDTAALVGRMMQLMPAGARHGFDEIVTMDARSGAQAIDLLSRVGVPEEDGAEDEPAVTIQGVLLDIRLGDMTGFDVLSTLERNPRLRNMPICIMSGDVTALQSGSLITPYLSVTRQSGLSTREVCAAVAALLNVTLPGVSVNLLPSAGRLSAEPTRTA
jgi:signal transduction histidine kinase/CheY-like chemotaxis protein